MGFLLLVMTIGAYFSSYEMTSSGCSFTDVR